MELKQDKETCKLSVISQTPTNWSDWGGLWTPCAGSVSPWNTHLGSEEYEPNGEHLCFKEKSLQCTCLYSDAQPLTCMTHDSRTLFHQASNKYQYSGANDYAHLHAAVVMQFQSVLFRPLLDVLQGCQEKTSM